MENNYNENYYHIEKAIRYISENFKIQPSLEDISGYVNISPFHFQRIFTEWAGVSPKKFLQYITIENAKMNLIGSGDSILSAAYKNGLSGASRLHDLFVTIEGMSPGEYKNGGESLMIEYSVFDGIFGKMIIGSTVRGICYMSFVEDEEKSIIQMKTNFPNAIYIQKISAFHRSVYSLFKNKLLYSQENKIPIHIKGTGFQLKVREALLKIPLGKLSTYGEVAKIIGNSKASRAVGSAVGQNPVALLIPCHRVIQSTGVFGNYHWGSDRKIAMIGWERSQIITD